MYICTHLLHIYIYIYTCIYIYIHGVPFFIIIHIDICVCICICDMAYVYIVYSTCSDKLLVRLCDLLVLKVVLESFILVNNSRKLFVLLVGCPKRMVFFIWL